MICIFQRTIQNHFNWERPSPGRLGPSGEGEYVQNNGFGHEDWNFNKDLLIDGNIYGYCYYQPTKLKRKEKFNILFATYTNRRWFLSGIYLNAEFIENPTTTDEVLLQKMNDLLQLGNSLGREWEKLSDKKLFEKLKNEAQWLKWRVAPDNIIKIENPILIPKNVFSSKNYRITKPKEIDKNVFKKLASLAQKSPKKEDTVFEKEFPEGREIEVKHKLRERNQELVRSAKEEFKKSHERFFCQICGFDFLSKYGEIGNDFIEGHHTVPISKIKGVVRTRIEDISLVCSNCHRMLHRKRPWLEMSELKGLLSKKS